MNAVRDCWASSLSARVLFYRIKQGQGGAESLLAVVVQRMVNSEKAGVMFTVDPAAGDPNLLVIESSWGLGETVVGGQVEPDRFVVRKSDFTIVTRAIAEKAFAVVRDGKSRSSRPRALPPERMKAPSLSDDEVRRLAELGVRTEKHFGAAQDMEFAIEAGQVFLVQTRPVTTSVKAPAGPSEQVAAGRGEVLIRGLGASPGEVSGRVRVLRSPDEGMRLQAGEILVAPVTTPDWVPFMRRAAAIVTDSGGMTSHTAIVSRELGLPCIVGARKATTTLRDGMVVTVDGREGVVRAGQLEPERGGTMPAPAARAGAELVTATRLYVNLGEPARAAEVARMPVDGVGLLRAEFLILEALQGVHPRLLLERGQAKAFVERLAQGVEEFARVFSPSKLPCEGRAEVQARSSARRSFWSASWATEWISGFWMMSIIVSGWMTCTTVCASSPWNTVTLHGSRSPTPRSAPSARRASCGLHAPRITYGLNSSLSFFLNVSCTSMVVRIPKPSALRASVMRCTPS